MSKFLSESIGHFRYECDNVFDVTCIREAYIYVDIYKVGVGALHMQLQMILRNMWDLVIYDIYVDIGPLQRRQMTFTGCGFVILSGFSHSKLVLLRAETSVICWYLIYLLRSISYVLLLSKANFRPRVAYLSIF